MSAYTQHKFLIQFVTMKRRPVLIRHPWLAERRYIMINISARADYRCHHPCQGCFRKLYQFILLFKAANHCRVQRWNIRRKHPSIYDRCSSGRGSNETVACYLQVLGELEARRIPHHSVRRASHAPLCHSLDFLRIRVWDYALACTYKFCSSLL